MLNKKIFLIICISVLPIISLASDLGTIGQTYPIIETDFLEFIQTRLKSMAADGELNKIQNKFKENVTRHTERPTPVSGISRTQQQKSWYIDPSITVPYDLRDQSGRVIVKNGTKVNPLSYIAIHHPMVFINGEDPDQVEWAKKIVIEKRQSVKLVLVNGSVAEIARSLQMPVYFDQEGRLTNRFHIQHVPAEVSQKGLQLLVEEVRV